MVCEKPKLMIKNSANKLRELNTFEDVIYKLYLIRKREQPNESLNLSFLQDGDEIIKIPCGHCLLCRTAEYKEWALRCWLEAREYENNQFITLTYNDENEPNDGVNREEITRFMHNIREHFRRKQNHKGIRFYACGEYGGKTQRAHYHILLFNCPPFGDEKKYKKTKRNHILYSSEILAHLWGKGFCTIGTVTRQSCDYVARFRLKNFDINQNLLFHCMSTQKGIGYDYLVRNLDRIIAEDKIHITGTIESSLPRFYDRKIKELIGQERFEKELAIPRFERARARIAEEMARTGLSEEEIYLNRVEQEKSKANELIKKFNKQGDD